jgi:SARP family transcriptional regulator, regulator of embCAB operon
LARPRIYLAGYVSIENGDFLVDERDFPGRQGRLAFVLLTLHRDRPIERGELGSIIWPDVAPQDPETALSAILSKLRVALKKAWPNDEAAIDVRSGTLGIRFPSETWIDVEDAVNSIDEAEGALRAGDPVRAWGFANVGVSIFRRPFLPDLDGPWINARRARHRTLLARALHCLATISAAGRESALAIQYMSELLDLEPYRETAYCQLMRLHAAMGNRAEALRVFGRCRELLRDELGASPSPQTEAVFLEILRAGES